VAGSKVSGGGNHSDYFRRARVIRDGAIIFIQAKVGTLYLEKKNQVKQVSSWTRVWNYSKRLRWTIQKNDINRGIIVQTIYREN
jgi:hypothetical protein